MKVLVVGAGGVVGSAVSRNLASQGAEVLALSRTGTGGVGTALAGDVRVGGLGLDRRRTEQVLDGLTHVVSCFGAVDWGAGPRDALATHRDGTRNVLDLAARAPALERVVHVSSVLALGRPPRRVGNADLDVGQRFRNWYEYGKFLAEREARARETVQVRVVRLGGILGADETFARTATSGLAAALPSLLRGYPIHLRDGGWFPVQVGDAVSAGEVLARAATDRGEARTWTWFDPRMPTLAEVLIGLCAAWRTMPKLVSLPPVRAVTALLGVRLGMPRGLLAYTEPWADIDPAVLDELPADLPACPDGYIEAAGEALLRHASRLGAAA
jgi:nucleoside-diphosphate-sugar epimerase